MLFPITSEYDYIMTFDLGDDIPSKNQLTEFLERNNLENCIIGKETDNYACLFFQREKVRCRLEYTPF